MLDKLIKHLPNFRHIKDEKELQLMWDHFLKAAPHSFGETHYELSTASGLSPEKWEEFRATSDVQKFIESQMAQINEVTKAKAMLNLSNARTSTDVQTAKFVQQLAKEDKTRSSKPFTIQFLPEDTLKYKKALLTIYKQIMDNDDKWAIIDTIFEVIPPTQEDINAITKAKALTKA